MANKIIALMLGLMLLCLVPIVLADDINIDSSITPIDEREAKSILEPYGAEVRLLQLEKSVTRNILIGDAVLNIIDENQDVEEAEKTLNTLEMLLEEIKTTPRTGDKNVLVQTYVELKKEARTLVSDFKMQTKDLITPQNRIQIINQIKEIDRNSFTKLNESIKEKARNFNAEKMKEHFKTLGFETDPMVERIRNGDANLKEVKEYALNKFKDLNLAEKKQLATQMKNDSVKRTVESKKIMEKVKTNLREKLTNNIQNRLENLNDWVERKGLDANTNGKYNRSERLTEQSERIEQIIKKINDQNGGNRK